MSKVILKKSYKLNEMYFVENDDANIPFFTSKIFQYTANDKCVLMIKVSGQGVKDKFEEPCSNKNPESYPTDGFVIIGNPNQDPLSLCLDKNIKAKLTVIRNGECTTRSYFTVNDVTTYTESVLDEATCTSVKTKMADEIEKHRIYWENWNKNFNAKMAKYNKYKPSPPPPPSYNYGMPSNQQPHKNTANGMTSPPPNHVYAMTPTSPWLQSGNAGPSPVAPNHMQTGNEGGMSSPTISVSASFIEPSEPCKQRITAVGNGVKDTFVEDCTENAATSINRNGLMVYGDPTNLPFCLFSEKPNTLVVVKKKVCILKTYRTANGVTTSTRSPMSIGKCSQIKRKMSDALKTRSNNAQQQTIISPQSVLPYPPVVLAPPVTPVVPPQSYPMYPQQSQGSFLPQPLSSAAPPTASTPVSNAVGNVGFAQPSASPTITYRPANSRINSPSFSRTNNNFNSNGRRVQELIIVGRGVNDYFKDYSQAKDLPTSFNNNNVLALRDSNGDFGLFTDTWGELWAFQKDKCSKRTYEMANTQTKITSTPMPAAECAAIKDKLTNIMGGGRVINFNGGQQVMNWNNKHINQNINSDVDDELDQALSEWERAYERKMARWEKELERRLAKYGY